MSAALISLVELDRVAAWMVVLIVSREFAVSVLRNVALSEGIVIVASEFGKAKMVSQVTAVSLLLLAPHSAIVEQVGYVVLWLALLLTVWSMVDYFRDFLQRTGNGHKPATGEEQVPVIRSDVQDVGNRT